MVCSRIFTPIPDVVGYPALALLVLIHGASLACGSGWWVTVLRGVSVRRSLLSRGTMFAEPMLRELQL